jgi:hypothetical protein
VYSLGVTAPQLFGDEDAAVDFTKLLHAEQEFEWTRQPRVGETVSFETDTVDASGSPVCKSRALFVIRA